MKRALLVIDVQMEYFTGVLPVTYPQGSLPNILRVMDAAAAAGIPTAVIQHHSAAADAPFFVNGSPGWELHPDVAARPRATLIHKQLPGSFTGTGLQEWLTAQGADTVVICGYMTQMCCDTTARQAAHLGYAVEFLSDATGTLDFSNGAGTATAEELHRGTLVTQAVFFCKVLPTDAWLQSIAAQAGA